MSQRVSIEPLLPVVPMKLDEAHGLNDFKYEPFGTVASNATEGVGFSNFTLRSAGADGVLGNADDIVMVDGMIVDRPAEADLPPSLLAPEKPRK